MMTIIQTHWPLIVALLFSSLLIILFMYLNSNYTSLLKVDSKWLALSMLPVLIVLLTGGYIYKFKGFGIEIETSLKEPIKDKVEFKARAQAEQAMTGTVEERKRKLSDLYNMTAEKKKSIERLSFINGYHNYDSTVVAEYLNELSNLEYIELLGSDSRFIGVMSADDLAGKEDEFVQSLAKGTVLVKFSHFIVTDSVDEDTSAIDALALIRKNTKRNFLPLLDKQGKMKGIVTAASLEKRIADDVLQASKRVSK